MKRIGSIAFLFVLSAGPLVAAAGDPASGTGTPGIRFAETSHNFGEITEGDVVSYPFHFESTGAVPLEITQIKPGCGCTEVIPGRVPADWDSDESKVVWSVMKYAPGERGVAKFVYDSKNRRGNTGSSATIFTNAPENAQVGLRIQANVVVPVEVMPSAAQFGFITADMKPSRDFHIKATGDSAFRILDATASNDRVHLELKRNETDAPDTVGYVLHVSLDPSGLKDEDVIEDTVRVRTSSDKKPLIEIPVRATVRPPVYATPPMVRLFQRQKDANPIGYLIVIAGGDEEAKILDIQSDIPNLSFQEKDLKNGKYQIAAELDVAKGDGPVSGSVVVKTSHPDVPTIRVPVTYTPIQRP